MKRAKQRAMDAQFEAPWKEQRECMLLLLKARMLMRKMVEMKLYEERLARGALSALEVHNLVRCQQEGDDTDFVAEITELKRSLMTDIRRNHALEKEVGDLDKRIGLLIHNVGHLATHSPTPRGKKKKGTGDAAEGGTLTAPKLALYSNLFYLLQTEPKYLARLVGVLADTEGVDAVLDTILLTLYGDAFSPREEFLILTLFKIAIEQEMQSITSISDFVKEQSVLAKMVLTYNRRKQGLEYMRQTLGPALTEFLTTEGSLELNARKIHQKLITDQETVSGVKSMQRTLTDDEIAQLPEVSAIVNKRAEQLQAACQLFLSKILGNVNRLPYGLRWICKQHRAIAQDAIPNAKPDDLNKMTSYFVYYRFINLGVVSPETFNITDAKITPLSVFNLVEVSKVLHHLFSFTPFDPRTERWYVPMNAWMAERTDLVRKYISELLDVENPEDALQVDRYIELTQMVKPTILVAVNEITGMHRNIAANIDKLATGGPEDKLRIIMRELGPVEEYADEDRELSLTLVNRFPAADADDATSPGNQLFHQTKAALISIMRQLPRPLPVIRTAGDQPTLGELLRAGAKWARSESQDQVRSLIDKARKNIEELEKLGLVSSDDGHRALLRAVTLEIANRAQIREQQNKELARLHLALRKAAEQSKYFNDQISQYHQYLQVVRERHVGAGSKHGKKRGKAQQAAGKIIGPFKFSYMELVKKRVIVDSEVPKPLQKLTKISISSEEPGIFDVEVVIPSVATEKVQLFLDDLLSKQSQNVEHDERGNITLDVNMTLFLLNRLFRK